MPRPFLSQIDSVIPKPDLKQFKKAVLILHDQLNLDPWPEWVQESKPLLIFIESREKGLELPHHKKKAIYVLSSMRHFALERFNEGFDILYHSTNGHFDDGLDEIQKEFSGEIYFMTPSEYDTRERLQRMADANKDHFNEVPNSFFLTDPDDWTDRIGQGYRMEYFYREMRKRTGYLMNGDQPVGGEWNYDEQNREKLPDDIKLPAIETFESDQVTEEVTDMIEEYFPDSFGSSDGFGYAVNREQAIKLLNQFVYERLNNFGPYEDALKTGNHTLFHSQLSVYLNNGLLLPGEVCEKALSAYERGEVRLNSVEGLIRQIIGWREFVRIYYEAMMPEIRNANHFKFTESLPEMYWTGETDLRCMQESVRPVLREGYLHHIQRLMVLSNFSNLTGSDPRELNRWFHLAYTDAYEWVVLPNVLGMSTFADGGVLASKPYVSGGNYINKMSDYCKNCRYSVTQKTGEDACPFNYLYWNFVDQQRDTFNDSGRVNFMVNMFDKKKSEEEKQKIRESSEKFLNGLKRYENG